MPRLTESPPYTPAEPVTELLHGVSVTDPYRWLEDQDSPRTREWLALQTQYARSYLDAIPGRERIQRRIRELLDVETYDSIQRVGNKYLFRKRLRGQEQPCIFLRDGADGKDELLINPSERDTGDHTAVRPLQLSPDGRLLLYEVKEGGERTGTFELLDIGTRQKLADSLPHGHLRGFAFSPEGKSFFYAHETVGLRTPYRAAYRHVIGTPPQDDQQVFQCSGEQLRLYIVPGEDNLGFLVTRFNVEISTDFYLWAIRGEHPPVCIVKNASYRLGPVLLRDRILAITDRDSSNSSIVQIDFQPVKDACFTDVIPPREVAIQNWAVTANRIYVSYTRGTDSEIWIFDLHGKELGRISSGDKETVRLAAHSTEDDDVLLERESFTYAAQVARYIPQTERFIPWSNRQVPFKSVDYSTKQVWFPTKDGTRIPISLVARTEFLDAGPLPTVMTSYGAHGIPMTPQFSVLVAFLLEHGCLFALPNIRGGSEFGSGWHEAAKRRHHQVAIDDFQDAATWLIATGHCHPTKLAIFGGSHSGLLVGAALTQRPDLFCAVLCMVPILDMLRYHLFDSAFAWRDEFGTADDREDFVALASYSPYHNVIEGNSYPATMFVSGDADRTCNPLHARKMTARLQMACHAGKPIILDYSKFRGHSPVLPLTERVAALTDRLAFLCDRLQIAV
jgi:prolyl oligopeptidase